MINYIGLAAGMGCGKSTAIELLKEEYGSLVKLVKFAGILYEIQDFIYDKISPVYSKPKDFIKDRKLLQMLGTDWGRGIDDSLWVKLWKAAAEKEVAHGGRSTIVISDDTRFDNEAEMIKSMGGVIVQITSERAGQRIDTSAGIKNHASEAGISKNLIDYTIRNDHTIESFRLELRNLFEKILSS